METTEYEKFKFLEQNREVKQAKVDKIKKSIEEIGYIKAHPILIDSKFNILDGQHRYKACVQLELPIIYEFHEGDLDINRIILKLNTNQSVWTRLEYIHYWSTMGKESYIEFKGIMNKHTTLGISNLISLCTDGDIYKGCIKDGSMRLFDKYKDILEFSKQITEAINFKMNKHLARAVAWLFRNQKVTNEDREKILKNKFGLLECANPEQYRNQFIQIMNKNKQYKTDFEKTS